MFTASNQRRCGRCGAWQLDVRLYVLIDVILVTSEGATPTQQAVTIMGCKSCGVMHQHLSNGEDL